MPSTARRTGWRASCRGRPPSTRPTGSAASARRGPPAAATSGTLADEARRNDALTTPDEQEFAHRVVAALGAYPAYYVHMAPRNLAGPDVPDLDAPVADVDPVELARRLREGAWVVDLRERAAFADSHLPGSVSLMLSAQFSTYLGWLLPWDADVTLLGDSPEQVAEARRQLVRIGRDELAGAATGDVPSLARGVRPETYRHASFADLAAAPDAVVLDVRRDDEVAGGRVQGSTHVPLHTLLDRLDDVPEGQVWVHCASGFRSAIAASLLARAGRDVVHVDGELDEHLARGEGARA